MFPIIAFSLAIAPPEPLAVAPPEPLAVALEKAVVPLLEELSTRGNESAWSFAYKDADLEVQFCAGPIKRGDSARKCHGEDTFAWGSTTKPITAVMLLQLAESGLLDLDAPVAPLVDPLLRNLAAGDNATSLVGLYGPLAAQMTTRMLLYHRSGLTEYDNKDTRKYQNTHPSVDLDPLWVLKHANLSYTPGYGSGTRGEYSSTGYTLLGLVAAAAQHLARWDLLNQLAPLTRASTTEFEETRFPVHGPCYGFVTATGEAGGTTIHGYQSAGHTEGLGVVDTYGLSCTQGWTCGNMVTTPRNVARFFWRLLRPVSRSACMCSPRRARPVSRSASPSASARAAHAEGGGLASQGALISNASLTQMRAWLPTGLRPGDVTFEYGLGLMNFNSMDWGFQVGALQP